MRLSLCVIWIQPYNGKRKCTSVIPYARLHVSFLYATKQIVPCNDWCELDGWIYIFPIQDITFWIQPSDSSVQAGFPKKNRWQSERGVQNKWISPGHIPHIWNLALQIRQKWKTCKCTSMRLYRSIYVRLCIIRTDESRILLSGH